MNKKKDLACIAWRNPAGLRQSPKGSQWLQILL